MLCPDVGAYVLNISAVSIRVQTKTLSPFPLIGKHILLINARKRAVHLRKSIRIMPRQNPFDPNILRKRLLMPQRKQTDAVRNLRSYAVICHQARFGGFIIHFKQTRLLAFVKALCRAANIRRTIAQPDGAKLILRPRRKLLWLGKGLVRAAAELGDDELFSRIRETGR